MGLKRMEVSSIYRKVSADKCYSHKFLSEFFICALHSAMGEDWPFLMAIHLWWLAILALGVTPTLADIQLFTSDALPSLSSACVAALTANISCTALEAGNTMYQLTTNLTRDFLDQMCTDECKSSISAYRKAAENACAEDEFDDRGNSSSITGSSGVYRPIVLPDYYFTNYNQRCLKGNSGEYCLFHLQSTDSQKECDECGLRMFQAEISNGYFYNDDLAEQYSSLTSSCGVSTLDPPTPTSVVVIRQVDYPRILPVFSLCTYVITDSTLAARQPPAPRRLPVPIEAP